MFKNYFKFCGSMVVAIKYLFMVVAIKYLFNDLINSPNNT